MDGSVVIDTSTVKEITELSSLGDDREPWISDDGLRMYFSRDLTPPGHGDIYVTSRTSPTGSFVEATAVTNLNSLAEEGRAWLTPDELTIAMSTGHDGPLDIHMDTRPVAMPFGTPDNRHLAMVNARGSQHFDPFLTPDLLRLYFAANSGPSSRLELLIATRASTDVDFGMPAQVPGVNDANGNQADPALYQDEQLLVFSAFDNKGGDADLWYATRSSATGTFGPRKQIPTVSTGADEFDPVLGHDGCDLYFASNRGLGRFHLFHATVTK